MYFGKRSVCGERHGNSRMASDLPLHVFFPPTKIISVIVHLFPNSQNAFFILPVINRIFTIPIGEVSLSYHSVTSVAS